MVKIMENPIRMDDLKVPLFFGNTHLEGPVGVMMKILWGGFVSFG